MSSTELTLPRLGRPAQESCGRLLEESWIKLIVSAISGTRLFRLATVWSAYEAIEAGSTALGSTTNTVSVSDGRLVMPMKSKSQTTTKRSSTDRMTTAKEELVTIRLPSERPPTHPGEMLLEEFLKPLGVSQSALAVQLDVSFPRLKEIVRHKRGVTPDTALRLERVVGMSADFWLGLQQDWDLWHAMRSEKAAAIFNLKPLQPSK